MMNQGLQGAARGQMPMPVPPDQGGMPPALEQEEMEAAPQGNQLSDEENLDVEIGTGLVMKFLKKPEAQKIVADAMDGQGDPSAKLGVFLSQMIDKVQTKMEQTPVPLSPRIWLSVNGVIDQVMNNIGASEPDLVAGVKDEIMNLLKLQSQSIKPEGGDIRDSRNANTEQMPPQEGPPMPMGPEAMV